MCACRAVRAKRVGLKAKQVDGPPSQHQCINPLLWEFNSFALARPFCESSKQQLWVSGSPRQPASAGGRSWVGTASGKSIPMGSIGRYIFRTTMGAFVIILVSLTVVLWFTQAMRDFDLITSQRQTLLVFVEITGLIIPLLVMMIAPIALVMAAAHVLNKLGSDSEIIVMNAAGVSPWRLLRSSRFWFPSSRLGARRAACGRCASGRRRSAPTFSPISCSPAASPP